MKNTILRLGFIFFILVIFFLNMVGIATDLSPQLGTDIALFLGELSNGSILLLFLVVFAALGLIMELFFWLARKITIIRPIVESVLYAVIILLGLNLLGVSDSTLKWLWGVFPVVLVFRMMVESNKQTPVSYNETAGRPPAKKLKLWSVALAILLLFVTHFFLKMWVGQLPAFLISGGLALIVGWRIRIAFLS